uniref:cyclic pyranopterin monophosphate synthase MoaC n=1 Tax=Arcanobacterium ihumii TaxID=2138162 RepID=UPI000F53B447|nr:cyclic pyranopterin monophosphate synthase MoaC [Arcanobacterium ihumii]
MKFTHLDSSGKVWMVDVTAKQPTVRHARAQAKVTCSPQVMEALRTGTVPKGDVLAVARVAGIAAAKKVPDLLPLAHTIGVHGAEVDVILNEDHVLIKTLVRTADRTGVEMEALTAANIAALTVVDMVKGVDRSAAITDCLITHKSGGRSGNWIRPGFEEELEEKC